MGLESRPQGQAASSLWSGPRGASLRQGKDLQSQSSSSVVIGFTSVSILFPGSQSSTEALWLVDG